MPTYDYVCDACDHRWELFQSITAEHEKKCPSCKKKKARRMIGAGAGLIFKGSGFYITDYRSSNYQKSADADQKSQSSGDAKPADSASPPAAAPSTPAPKAEAKSDAGGGAGKSAKK